MLLSLRLGVLSLGLTSFCLRLWFGLKCTGILCSEKILLSFSNTPATYGSTMLLHLLFFSTLLSVEVLFLRPSADLMKARITEGFKCFLMCARSFSFPSAWDGTFAAWWCKVPITPGLCSSGWLESKSKYWSVCGFFWLTSKLRLASSSMWTAQSGNCSLFYFD